MRQRSTTARVVAALLCVLLALFMTVEVAHQHADGSLTSLAQCQLCATAHTATTQPAAWLTPFVVRLLGTVIIGDPCPRQSPALRTARIRPPPASSSVAA